MKFADKIIGQEVAIDGGSRYDYSQFESSVAQLIGGYPHANPKDSYDIAVENPPSLVDVKLSKFDRQNVAINVSCVCHAIAGEVTDFLVVTPSEFPVHDNHYKVRAAYDFPAAALVDFFMNNVLNGGRATRVNTSVSADEVAGKMEGTQTEGHSWPILFSEDGSFIELETFDEIEQVNTMRGPITNFTLETITPGTEVEFQGQHYKWYLSNNYVWVNPSLAQ